MNRSTWFSGAVTLLVWQVVTCVSVAESPEGYKLVWADEFDKDGPPNNANWGYERGFVRNEELQWYQPENARCRDGMLVIEGRRERLANANYSPGSRQWNRRRESAEYTSASMKTQGRHEWCYGLFEIRARIDARSGLWPAIWTLGRSGRWPAKGEIDIMEYYDDSILANACWAKPGRRNPVWDSSKTKLASFGEDWATEFHTWRMWWDERQIRLAVDDRTLNTIDLAQVDRDTGSERNPFRQPHFLILNLAIGGTQGGDPSQTKFPARYLVDYVRVYERQSTDNEPR